MIKSILSLVLLVISVVLSIKHGWDTFHYKKNPETIRMMSELGITDTFVPFFGIVTFVIGILLLIPKTYFLGNVINAMSIVLIMALALRAENYKMALIEIPFLVMPLVMIWLKYPFKN
ncbi:hypothetical protein [Flectobacillus major]|jgi:uncharacterized membrane protein YphA (DoxX/SURF4 family)|uniref:hypothetical protein n=1 Tax=Flectobacillus major TaxID=103 RepID=UPI0003F4ACC9|nr:hypothetical protein [Flectobacillus major]